MPINYLQNKWPNSQQPVGLVSNEINATQSSMPADKYGMIGPHSLIRETLEVHMPIPYEIMFAYNGS